LLVRDSVEGWCCIEAWAAPSSLEQTFQKSAERETSACEPDFVPSVLLQAIRSTPSFRFLVVVLSTMSISQKRACNDENDLLVAKMAKPGPHLDETHPFYILKHWIRNVLPKKSEAVCKYYKTVLDDPEGAIAECKQHLADWVVEYWKAVKINKLDEYESHMHNSLRYFPDSDLVSSRHTLQ
jgi:hypothetical protein